MTASLIDVGRRGETAIVTLRRPPANAMDNAMDIELTEAIASLFHALEKTDR